jgi:hypothetical protein
MKARILVGTLLSVHVCLLMSESGSGCDTRDNGKEGKRMRTLDHELAELGALFDCWFTIERHTEVERRASALRSADLTLDPAVRDAGALARALAQNLRGVCVLVDSNNARVIHLIADTLVGKRGYALAQTASVDFAGVLADLPTAIGESVEGIGTRKGGFNHHAYNDHVTQVELHAVQKEVRSILTDAVPLDKYSRVLWVAEAREANGKLETSVQYTGPRTKVVRGDK